MCESRCNWPMIFFVAFLLAGAGLMLASRQGWVKLGGFDKGGCCAKYSCSKPAPKQVAAAKEVAE